MSVLDTVKRANAPGPPEHSIQLRAAAGGAVIVAIAGCHAEGELTALAAVGSSTLVAAGMVFSYLTRERPRGWVKPILAVSAVAAFVWFIHTALGRAHGGGIASVEGPLAGLFAWIQVGHAFDVPARRDLSFSLTASAALMAVAGAQAVAPNFGLYVIVWVVLGVWCLLQMWRSVSGGGLLRPGLITATLVALALATFGALLVLPAPHVSGTILFPSGTNGNPLNNPDEPNGDNAGASEPAQAGSSSGATRVGGYLGFAKRLDTALRGDLSSQVVMRVRADRPSYWLGETFDTWDGVNWTTSSSQKTGTPIDRDTTSSFNIPTALGEVSGTQSDIQTFYVTTAQPNLIFHADVARRVWFPVNQLEMQPDGTLLSGVSMGPGTIYTVDSLVQTDTPAQLRATQASDEVLPPADLSRYTAYPTQRYARVRALAQRITRDAPTVYDKVQALIAWIGANTHYSTDIPPLAPGQDTVNQFLFGSVSQRVGFCEQISTAMAVMLRTLGIPAREAVGYVPGAFNPITDLWDVEAKDAHAWVQVWFPTYGWQNFDPTAVVPLANPSPSSALLHDVGDVLSRAPWVPVGVPLVAVVGAVYGLRRLRRRPHTWVERVAATMERAGRRAGRPRAAHETLTAYAARLDQLAGDRSGAWAQVAARVEADAYGGGRTPPEEGRRLLQELRARRLPHDRAGPAGVDDPARPLVGAAR